MVKPDARLDIPCHMGAVFVAASLTTLAGAGSAVVLALLFGLLQGASLPAQAKRIKLPLVLLLPLFLFLPFTSGGTVLWHYGVLSLYREGLELALLIFLRVTAILLFTMAVYSSFSIHEITSALRALRLPAKFIDMLQVTWRYLFIYREDLRKMHTALVLRGQKPGRSGLRMGGSLIGSLLVRSYEQTDTLYHAMVLRGYGETPAAGESSRPGAMLFLRGLLMLLVPGLVKIYEVWRLS